MRVLGCLGRLLLESGGRSFELHLQIFKFRCQHVHLLIMSGRGRDKVRFDLEACLLGRSELALLLV